MNILLGYFGQPDKSPMPLFRWSCAVFNNDRKVGLIEEKIHGLQYAPGSIRMRVLVKR